MARSGNVLPDDISEELAARFLINLPKEEYESFDRLMWAVQEAHWHYEDFLREPHHLPSLNFRTFSEQSQHTIHFFPELFLCSVSLVPNSTPIRGPV